jgi:hypothetical protein
MRIDHGMVVHEHLLQEEMYEKNALHACMDALYHANMRPSWRRSRIYLRHAEGSAHTFINALDIRSDMCSRDYVDLGKSMLAAAVLAAADSKSKNPTSNGASGSHQRGSRSPWQDRRQPAGPRDGKHKGKGRQGHAASP